jgi:hypothetical protein
MNKRIKETIVKLNKNSEKNINELIKDNNQDKEFLENL